VDDVGLLDRSVVTNAGYQVISAGDTQVIAVMPSTSQAMAIHSPIAVLSELDRLLDDPQRVTELDLADRGLRSLPDQLFRFPNLRRLRLAGNDQLNPLPDRIGELVSLEELDLSRIHLTRLPATLGRLRGLRVLDLSDNELAVLPDELGELTRLRVLRARGLWCAPPDTLAGLISLEELDLASMFHPAADGAPGPVPFPRVVTRLPALRRLDLSDTRLDALPDDLLQLTTLEELSLNGAVGAVDRLPDLTRLPRLRVLRLDGGRATSGGDYPHPRLLEGVWPISTLEELTLAHWGEKTEYDRRTRSREVVRGPLTGLPDNAFAELTRLRRLDLSGNELTELPESFYALTGLTEVDLQYTRLNAATFDRLAEVFPEVHIDLRHVAARKDPDDPGWWRVNKLVTDAGRAQTENPSRAARLYEQALALCVPGARFAEYDQLYALNGLIDVLGRLRQEATGSRRATAEQRQEIEHRLESHAETALALIPAPGTIRHYTELGAFQEEVSRRAGDALARLLLERGDPARAGAVADRALAVAGGPDHDYLWVTKVRILLAAGQREDAYRIADQVLTREPTAPALQDIAAAPDFRAWRSRRTT
jgi:Leucine-rich repeat (LRR) protein